MTKAIRHSMRALLTALLMLMLAANTYALDPKVPFHHYRFDHWGPDEGLPQISVLTITQDRLGYLWLGTQNGIARFDGSRFTVYDRNSTGVDTTLPTSSVATPDGRVWFGTPRGVLWIRGEQVHDVGKGTAMIGVLDIAHDRNQRVLAASESGLFVVEGDRLRRDPSVSGPAFSLLSEGANVWVGGRGVVTRMEAGKAERIALPDPALKVARIARDGDSLWLGTQTGLRRFDLRTRAFDTMGEIGSAPIDSLLLDSSGNLWVGTLDRLQRRHPGGAWETVEAGDLFAQPWIDAIFEDREGELWLGSHRESLVRLRDSALSRIGTHEGLADPFAWSVLRDRNGALLLGTSHGLFEVDGAAPPREIVGAAALPQAQVYSLDEDPDGTLWIGTRGGLAVRQSGVTAVPPALAALAGVQVDAVQRIGDSDYWIATLEGLYRYRGGELRAVGPHDGSPASKVRTILPQDADHILIGTDAGIFSVKGEHYTRLPGTEALSATFVPRMAWLKPGLLAITTMDRGLGLWRDGHLLLLGKDNGLPTVNGWTLDVIDRYLYVASIDGVYRVALADLPDPAAKPPFQLRTQVVVEGSQRGSGGRRFGCCNGGGDARTLREGTMLWIASSAGAVRLDTRALPAPATPPAALIESVRNGANSFPGNAPLAIDGDSRDLEIDYTGLSLVDSARLEFRYRLAGYDDDWKEASTRRVAFYTHLPPGDYRFEVQARSPFGAWGAGVAPLPIRVLPNWFEHGGVRLGALALAALLGLFAVLRHNAGLRSHARELRLAVDERTRELRLANDRLERLSRTDSLTGLGNRRGIDTQARGAERDWTGAALMIDIDHFKRINDDHGHDYGDRVLVALGDILRANTRADDRVLRWGGEEFLIVSQRLAIDDALVLAERIRAALSSRRFESGDGAPRITCSVGIASLPVHPGRAGDLDASIAMADYALYRAKHEGRDRTCAVLLPADAEPGTSQGELREEVERLDAAGRLSWRTPLVQHA
jgi:diguanylate cyclase (GGDEF)-like protein